MCHYKCGLEHHLPEHAALAADDAFHVKGLVFYA